MKEITKDNKGITLVSLIITIIIMSILVSVATYSGIDTYRNAKITNFVAQMQLIQTKVDELVDSKTVEEINNMGLQEITTNEQKNAINMAYNNQEITSNTITDYKLITTDNIVNLFEIEDIENDIMVNFKTREVVSVKGIEYEGTTYYTQYKLPNGQAIIQNTTKTDRNLVFNIEQPRIDGLNATITIKDIEITNGTLRYKEENDNYWQTITNYTKAEDVYTIAISKTGIYEFVLTDNVTGENSNIKTEHEETGEIIETIPDAYTKTLLLANAPTNTNQQITNPYDYSMDSSNWAIVSYNGVNYVWIPRFAYKTDDEGNNKQIKFLKGNSNIATDNTYIDDTWTIHEKFTNNGTELTGVWINIDIQIELKDMDRILDDASYDVKTEILKEEEL